MGNFKAAAVESDGTKLQSLQLCEALLTALKFVFVCILMLMSVFMMIAGPPCVSILYPFPYLKHNVSSRYCRDFARCELAGEEVVVVILPAHL